MQCTSCGATLQPGVTTCPSCGATVVTDTSDSSPYEADAEAVPYIPYMPLKEKEAVPASSPLPVQEGSRGTDSLAGIPPQQAVSSADSGSQAQVSRVAQPPMVQQGWPVQPQVVQPKPQQRRGHSASVIALSIVLVLLIIGSGGGLIYYATGPYPTELHAQATAVVQSILTTQAQANAQATATVNALGPQDFYTQITSTKPGISDPMSRSDTSSWISSNAAGSSCGFTNGAFHASIAVKSTVSLCPAILGTDFSNFVFQVQMTIIKGDAGGLFFRANNIFSGQVQSYFLEINQFGFYSLSIFQNSNQSKSLKNGVTLAMNTGLNQPNQVAVVARGSNFYFYLNKQYFANLSDSTYSSGMIGVLATSVQNPTEVAFSNAQVWLL